MGIENYTSLIDAVDSEVAVGIEAGRRILYDESTGLYDLAMCFLDVYEDKEVAASEATRHREAIRDDPGTNTRYEVYTAKQSAVRLVAGISIRRVIGARHMDTETSTLLLPPSGFVSSEHTLKRDGAVSRKEHDSILRPPTLIVAGLVIVDGKDTDGMNKYLRDYTTTADSMRRQLTRIIGME